MSPRKTQKILAIILVGSVLLFVASLWLSGNFLNSQATNIAQQKAESDALASQYQTLQTTKSQLKQLGDTSQLVDRALPKTADQSLMIAELNSIAKVNGVALVNITFVQPDTPTTTTKKQTGEIPGVATTAVSLDTGPTSYGKMIDFLKAIENNRWLIQPTGIDIQPGANGSIQKLSLTINFFTRK